MQNLPETLTYVERPNTTKLAQQVHNQLIYMTDRVRLHKYRKAISKEAITVVYQRKTFNGKPYGRYFPARGVLLTATYQWRKIRATLFAETTNDIDIQNCHPVILEQLYRRIGGTNPTPALSEYVKNRDRIIADCQIKDEAITRYNAKNNDNISKRDLIKALFTMVIYGGGLSTFQDTYELTQDDYTLTDFFGQYRDEMRMLRAQIIATTDQYISQLVTDFRIERGKDADDDALLSLILQDLEAQIICCALAEFPKLSSSKIVAYMYDGFMVNKDPNIDNICIELSRVVRERTGYSVIFLNKPFEEPLAVPKVGIPPILDINNTSTIDDYEDTPEGEVDRLIMETCVYVSRGGKSVWMLKMKNDNDEIEYTIMPSSTLKANLVDFTKTVLVEVNGRGPGRPAKNTKPTKKFKEVTIELADRLRQLRGMVKYRSINFCPRLRLEEVPRDILNLFNGYKHAYEDQFIVDMTLIQPLLDHIFNIWCSQGQVEYDYILNWFASIIQMPHKKMGVAVLLKSTHQGAGKNIITNFISNHVIGAKYATTLTNSEHLFNKFNSVMENKLLVVLDEIMDNGLFLKLNDRLKALITQERIQIERKGIDMKEINDFTNYILLTNNNMPIKVELKDRRYFTLEVSNEKANDTAYFDPFVETLTPLAGKHFFHYLAQRDISNFSPRNIPITQLKKELKLNSAPLPILYLYRLSTDDVAPKPEFVKEDGSILCGARELYDNFIQWTTRSNFRHNMSDDAFWKAIQPIMKSERKWINKVQLRAYVITIDELKNKCASHLGQ